MVQQFFRFWQKRYFWGATLLVISSMVGILTPVWALYTGTIDTSDRGRTAQRGEGASTGGACVIANRPDGKLLTTLVPRPYTALTLNGRPTFWLYIPYEISNFSGLSLVLQQQSTGEDRRTISLPIPVSEPGVIKVEMPLTEPSLAVDKKYDWFLSLSCRSGSALSTSGGIKFVNPSTELQQELAEAKTPQAKAAAYAKHGIWFDALTELGNARINDPSNAALEQDWKTLLEDVDLESISDEKIVVNREKR
jgi:hypothetical protein